MSEGMFANRLKKNKRLGIEPNQGGNVVSHENIQLQMQADKERKQKLIQKKKEQDEKAKKDKEYQEKIKAWQESLISAKNKYLIFFMIKVFYTLGIILVILPQVGVCIGLSKNSEGGNTAMHQDSLIGKADFTKDEYDRLGAILTIWFIFIVFGLQVSIHIQNKLKDEDINSTVKWHQRIAYVFIFRVIFGLLSVFTLNWILIDFVANCLIFGLYWYSLKKYLGIWKELKNQKIPLFLYGYGFTKKKKEKK